MLLKSVKQSKKKKNKEKKNKKKKKKKTAGLYSFEMSILWNEVD